MKIFKINKYVELVAYVSNQDFNQYLYNRIKGDIDVRKLESIFKTGLNKVESISIDNPYDAGYCHLKLFDHEFLSLYGFLVKEIHQYGFQTRCIFPYLSFIERLKTPMKSKIGCDYLVTSDYGFRYYFTNSSMSNNIENIIYSLTSEQRRKYYFKLVINYPYLNLVNRRKRYFKSLIKQKQDACKDQSSAERILYRIIQYARRFFKKT